MKTKSQYANTPDGAPGLCQAISRRIYLSVAIAIAISVVAFAQTGHAGPLPGGKDAGSKHNPPAPPPVQFAVISDPHLYDTRLGTTGSAFESYLNQDPKLLRQSEAILESALDAVIQQHVRFVIIPGDLTKDGEQADHVLMARHLAKLEQHGIQVYVVPGNHDINNPDALAFKGDTTRPVPTVSPKNFRALYQRFGYGQAIDRDLDSLSYVAEPVKGLWLIAIDSTDTAQNQELGYPRVGGKLSPNTLAWILAKLQQANAKGKKVIAFMHHGVNPNSLAQPQLFPEYLVDNWPLVGAQLNAAGLKVVFTGHYHSQDAAFPLDANANPVIGGLYDVETSSLAAYPSAFRIVTLQADNSLKIESRRVTEIQADTGGRPFQDFAEADLRLRLPAIAAYQLETDFGATPQQAAYLAPFVVDALVAGYGGDEQPDTQTQAVLNGFVGSAEPLHSLGQLLWALWIDLPPADNNLVVPMAN